MASKNRLALYDLIEDYSITEVNPLQGMYGVIFISIEVIVLGHMTAYIKHISERDYPIDVPMKNVVFFNQHGVTYIDGFVLNESEQAYMKSLIQKGLQRRYR